MSYADTIEDIAADAVSLGKTRIKEFEVEVFVRPDGEFQARVADQLVTADTLFMLKGRIADAITAARVEVPFAHLDKDGVIRRGVMRGFHAANRDILVTWADNGEKGVLSSHAGVVRTLDDQQVVAARAAARRVEEAQEELAAMVRPIREAQVSAKDLFVEALGEDLFDYMRHIGGRS